MKSNAYAQNTYRIKSKLMYNYKRDLRCMLHLPRAWEMLKLNDATLFNERGSRNKFSPCPH